MVQHWLRKHDCPVHTTDVVGRLGLLLPRIPEEERAVRPAELADWITVEAEDEPEIANHRWLVELEDGVSLLIRPDHDDLAELLGEQSGVRSVIQLDREVLTVEAPRLCADGLRAAVMQAVAAANRRAHDPHPAGPSGTPGGDAVVPSMQVPATQPKQPVEPPEDDDLCRLVSGDAAREGRKVQDSHRGRPRRSFRPVELARNPRTCAVALGVRRRPARPRRGGRTALSAWP